MFKVGDIVTCNTNNLYLKLPTRNLAMNPCVYLHYLPNYATVDITPEI